MCVCVWVGACNPEACLCFALWYGYRSEWHHGVSCKQEYPGVAATVGLSSDGYIIFLFPFVAAWSVLIRLVTAQCDRQLPHCGQCTRTREQCSGYRDKWDLVFRNQTDDTIKRTMERRAPKEDQAALPPNCNSRPLPPPGLSSSLDELGGQLFSLQLYYRQSILFAWIP